MKLEVGKIPITKTLWIYLFNSEATVILDEKSINEPNVIARKKVTITEGEFDDY